MTLQEILKETFTFKIIRFLLGESIAPLSLLGESGKNLLDCIKLILKGKIHWKNTLEQMNRVGINALTITLILSSVAGMIIALQVAAEMAEQGASNYVGTLVSITIVRELGPVIAAFAVTSLIGSSMASELATMKVTDQINSMKVLHVDPTHFLLVPRIIAGTIMVPMLVVIGCILGVLGGMLVSNIIADINMLNYLQSVWQGLSTKDIYVSIIKGTVFGLLITSLSSSIGYATRGGAKEVGKATTTAVVWSFLAIVIFNYIISLIFFT